ncbi:MAG: efflux RND transporter permease subunit [Candidatus Auribacterota bacterium]|jgi:multidrug efflux pump subunit AcrB|nr:efflux RND transporter permease subunit [Candidatus Auribacterota bacterium]
MSIGRFSVRQRVPVNFAVIIVVIAGIYMYNTLPRETFPLISTKVVTITTLAPDISSPLDIEKLITIPIEEEIDDVDGIDEILSTSIEGVSTITVKADDSVDNIYSFINDLRQQVDIAKSKLPDTAEDPIIQEVKFSIPVITVAISGNLDMLAFKKYVDILEDNLKLIKGVRDVLISGVEDREVWVEIDPLRMASYNLTIDDVSRAIIRKNINLSGGMLKTSRGEFQIRALGELISPVEIMDIIVKKDVYGRAVKISDFAVVADRFAESKTLSRVDGDRAISLTIIKTEEADAINLSQKIRDEVKEYKKILPEGLAVSVFSDTSKYIFNRIKTMENSAVLGLLLVSVLLIMFLNWRISIMTALSIPVAMCGAMVLLWATGNTINLLTMFGMIMALGMIVDDSVVVVENVFRYIEKGMDPVKAAIRGADEVFWPVLGSVTTTIAAFSPLVFMTGDLGKFMAFIPLTVIFALLASLFEAFFVLPSHLADFVVKPKKLRKNRLLKPIVSVYTYALKKCLRNRYWFLLLCILMIFFTAFMAKKNMRFVLFSTAFVDEVYIRVTCPERNKLEDTEEVVKRIEERIFANLPPHEYHTVDTTIGRYITKDRRGFKIGTNLAWIRIDIAEENKSTRRAQDIIQHLISVVQDIPGATSIEVASQGGGPPQGQAVEVEVSGVTFEQLKAGVEEIKKQMSTITGVQNIADNFEAGKDEYRIVIDEEKANMFGLDNTDINKAIRNTFAGLKSSNIRIGNDDIDIVVKAMGKNRKLREDIEDLELKTGRGYFVRLKTIADIQRVPGYNTISRKNGKRIVSVTADVDEDITTSAIANKALSEKLADFSYRYPGLTLYWAGQAEDTRESLRSLAMAFAIAFLVIYMIIGAIFHSFVQPFVVVLIIPFAFVGVIIGLIISNQPMGLMALLGLVALTGIVVNDSIVMVDFINQRRREGKNRWESIIRAGRLRFRPIMLTSVTTIVGLLPLIFSGGQTQMLAPMALAISWGLAFGTVLTLLLIPTLITVIDDIKIKTTGEWQIQRFDD